MVTFPRVALLFALASQPAAQGVVVSPPQYGRSQGSAGTFEPWWNVGRYQQLDGNLRGTARTVRGLAWRRSGQVSNSATLDFELSMAETDRALASATFASNHATPPVVVFTRKQVMLQSGVTHVLPAPFDFSAPFDVPFAYSGARDILWEAVLHVHATPASMDGVDDANGNVGGAVTPTGPGCNLGIDTLFQNAWIAGQALQLTLTLYSLSAPMPKSAPGVLLLGTSNPALIVPGLCAPLQTDAIVSLAFQTNSSGWYSSPSIWAQWAPTFQGTTLYGQAAVLDLTQGGLPVWLSNGHAVAIPDLWQPSQLSRVYLVGPPAAAGTLTIGKGLVTRYSL